MVDRKEVAWCTTCGARFTSAELDGQPYGCPKCGVFGLPCDPNEDVTVKINWHELRILGIWAENWAHKHKDDPAPHDHADPGSHMLVVVHAICRRLQQQHPTLTPLTLSQEIAELPAKLAERGVEVGQIETRNIAEPPFVPDNSTDGSRG